MTPRSDALAALASIEEAQSALRTTLRDVRLARLTRRPATGEWSPMEHLRHLVFAQQLHVKPHLPKGFRWTSAGVPPPNRTGERRLSPVGSDPSTTIDEVFEAWSRIDDVVRGLCNEAPDEALVQRLDGNLKHLNIHAHAIEQLLRT